jgi:hypothetical protein
MGSCARGRVTKVLFPSACGRWKGKMHQAIRMLSRGGAPVTLVRASRPLRGNLLRNLPHPPVLRHNLLWETAA